MFAHAPASYLCPFCSFIKGRDDKFNIQDDIVFRNQFVTAFVAPSWWVNNKGHVLVVPNQHYENIYTIPDEHLAQVYKAVKQLAVAIRTTYNCEGISTRQHNEPVGDQDVWHLHVHVFPRYKNDKLYANHDTERIIDPSAKATYAKSLKAFFASKENRSPQ